VLKGRAAVRTNLRSYYFYVRNPKQNKGNIEAGNMHFVFHRQPHADARRRSKARVGQRGDYPRGSKDERFPEADPLSHIPGAMNAVIESTDVQPVLAPVSILS